MLLKSPNKVSLVLDCWTDNFQRRSFINYRVHYCSNFEMVTVTLKTAIFEHPHTAVRIKDNIISTLEEFNLSKKEIIAVTDNGANIVAALRLAKIQRLSCISHCLHLFLTSDISKNPK